MIGLLAEIEGLAGRQGRQSVHKLAGARLKSGLLWLIRIRIVNWNATLEAATITSGVESNDGEIVRF